MSDIRVQGLSVPVASGIGIVKYFMHGHCSGKQREHCQDDDRSHALAKSPVQGRAHSPTGSLRSVLGRASCRTSSFAVRHLTQLPETNLFLFGLLLNFPWEILQSPDFQGLAEAPHWEPTKACTAASLGDAGPCSSSA
jgi:hypothetical protein